eukprot:TRINITY_DN29513_c0_g1_i1.p1 TRINITY_DN29513_c0_g1~~TRINITY_DN29513_c0_g1_i1.p1  ORF type:complete len:296 (-),score=69.08 TRINITY_DN29513_c0_g1_i1:76-963(-)
MGIAEDDLADPAAVSKRLRCGWCAKVFNDPVYCGGEPCEHAFCRGCLLELPVPVPAPSLEDSQDKDSTETGTTVDDGTTTAEEQDAVDVDELVPKVYKVTYSTHCPICKADVSLLDLKPHRLLRELVAELRVHCGRRCGWSGCWQGRAEHDDACPLVELDALEKQLADADAEIAELVDERDAQITALAVQACDERILERERRISELEAQVADGDSRLIDYGKQLLQKEVQITALERRLREQNAYADAVAATAAAASQKRDRFEQQIELSPQRQPDLNRRVTSSLEDMIAGSELDI